MSKYTTIASEKLVEGDLIYHDLWEDYAYKVNRGGIASGVVIKGGNAGDEISFIPYSEFTVDLAEPKSTDRTVVVTWDDEVISGYGIFEPKKRGLIARLLSQFKR